VSQWPQVEEAMAPHGALSSKDGTAFQLEMRRFERIPARLQEYF